MKRQEFNLLRSTPGSIIVSCGKCPPGWWWRFRNNILFGDIAKCLECDSSWVWKPTTSYGEWVLIDGD